MNKDIKYLKDNFIKEEELCKLSKISSKELERLISVFLIPKASYVVKSTSEISSSLEDVLIINETEEYFPKSTIKLIEENKKTEDSSKFKEKIKLEFMEVMNSSLDKKYAYNNILIEENEFDKGKLEEAFEEEWKHYCNGIYGICTLNSSGKEIAQKEIVVKKIIAFNKKYYNVKLEAEEKETLKSLSLEYNKVSNLFAPYQRKASSRGKYLDEILKFNSMDELIKKYN